MSITMPSTGDCRVNRVKKSRCAARRSDSVDISRFSSVSWVSTSLRYSICRCAPSPTKNKVKARDPQMQQTKKGNQWHFSMKAHIGTASQSKLMHPMAFTAAHAHDSQALPHLLHGAETRAQGDSAYAGPADIIKAHAPAHAFDFTHHKATRNHPPWKSEKAKNTTKSRVRAKVEHAF